MAKLTKAVKASGESIVALTNALKVFRRNLRRAQKRASA